MIVREATADDADAVCQVLKRSISELCLADHAGDPVRLAGWLQNKTPANIGAWISQLNSFMVVALENGSIVGVGAVTSSGEITLNYVSPDARFRGVSRTILSHLERKARQQGNQYCTLTTTKTAHLFYISSGYEDISSPEERSIADNRYMWKRLFRENPE